MFNWTIENMELALEAVRNGPMTQRKAAFTFQMSLTTLSDRINGKYLEVYV